MPESCETESSAVTVLRYLADYLDREATAAQRSSGEHVRRWPESLRQQYYGKAQAYLDARQRLLAVCADHGVRLGLPVSNETAILDTELPVRARNCLLRAGINTVGVLLRFSESDLRRVRNLGKGNLEHIKRFIDEHGLSLRSDGP